MTSRWTSRALAGLCVAALANWTWADAAGKPWDPAMGTAAVKGKVKLNGAAPKRKPVDMGSDPACAGMHQEPLLTETTIVGDAGQIKNVFVWVKRGLEGWVFKAPAEPVVLEQKGCQYVPRVSGVMVGQSFKIRNSDPLAHNVHGMPKLNSEFNIGQATQGGENVVTFTEPEVCMKVKCDIHGWMVTYVAVVPHPFFAITADDGTFALAGLPPGEYVIEAWHEKLGKSEQVVKVEDKESKDLEFTFEGK